MHEQVTLADRHRRWRVALDHPGSPTDPSSAFAATLYSADLTIDHIKDLLDPATFEYIKPHTLAHEREAFGGVLARRRS